MRRRRAFSLVELTVVGGLLAILLTVLYESSFVGTQASAKGIARLDSVMKANRFCEQLKYVLRTAKVVRAVHTRHEHASDGEATWTIDYVEEVDERTLAHRDARAVVIARAITLNNAPAVELSFARGKDRPLTYTFPEAQVRLYGARKLLAGQVTLEGGERHAFAVGSPYFEAALSNLEPPEAAVVDLLTPPPGMLVGGRIQAGRTGPPAERGPVSAPGPVVAPGIPPIARGAAPAAVAPPVAAQASSAMPPPVAPAANASADGPPDNFPPALVPTRPAVTPLAGPPADPVSWNGANAIDPGAAGASRGAESVDASSVSTDAAPAAPRSAGRLVPVGKLFPGLAKAAAPTMRPRPSLTDPAALAALGKPEARLKNLRARKAIKGAEQELPAASATNTPFE